MSQPTVYIGIILYNSCDDLPRCLAALRQLSYASVRLMALDNQSPDDSVDWLSKYAPEVKVLRSPVNLGYGRGHNRLLAELNLNPVDFYLPLNPDVILSSDYVSLLVEALMRTGAGWGIGKLRRMDASGVPTGLLYSAGQGIRRDGYVINVGEGLPEDAFNEEREIFVASGAAMLIRGELIHDLAPEDELFDANMFMYAEDIDLGWRARRRGWRCLYVPRATALHRGGMPSAAMRIQALGNCYLSTIKNAYVVDLLTLNLPLIIASCSIRVLVSPRRGIVLLRQLAHGVIPTWRKRQPPILSRREMLRWFSWSRQQPTQQATHAFARFTSYTRQAP